MLNAVMMAVARNVAQGCSSLKDGKWERSKFTGIELKGKTLAIVGAGKGAVESGTKSAVKANVIQSA